MDNENKKAVVINKEIISSYIPNGVELTDDLLKKIVFEFLESCHLQDAIQLVVNSVLEVEDNETIIVQG